MKERNSTRDLDILHYLVDGPVSLDEIYEVFFKTEAGELVTRQVFNRNMKRLADEGLIIISEFNDLQPSRKYRIATLDSRGANFVTRSRNLERDHIRLTRPGRNNLEHELIISKLCRKIHSEEKNGFFQILSQEDDSSLKRLSKKQKNKNKDEYYPDLLFGIMHCMRGSQIALEFDNGNKSKSYWTAKIESWGGIIVMISRQIDRLERLWGYIDTSRLKAAKLCFVPLEVFLNHGLKYVLDTIKENDTKRIFRFYEALTRKQL